LLETVLRGHCRTVLQTSCQVCVKWRGPGQLQAVCHVTGRHDPGSKVTKSYKMTHADKGFGIFTGQDQDLPGVRGVCRQGVMFDVFVVTV